MLQVIANPFVCSWYPFEILLLGREVAEKPDVRQ